MQVNPIPMTIVWVCRKWKACVVEWLCENSLKMIVFGYEKCLFTRVLLTHAFQARSKLALLFCLPDFFTFEKFFRIMDGYVYSPWARGRPLLCSALHNSRRGNCDAFWNKRCEAEKNASVHYSPCIGGIYWIPSINSIFPWRPKRQKPIEIAG